FIELGALMCQAPVSVNVTHCPIPCRVSYWGSTGPQEQASFNQNRLPFTTPQLSQDLRIQRSSDIVFN
ncbi:mCG145617, partial [Mus musculus]